MNIGKTLFVQVMEFIPWSSFSRIVKRYQRDASVRSLSAAEHFRVMAFSQLTWRESLRDTEASLGANPSKLYGMGFHSLIKKSTLADANERRDWRIWADLAAVLIRRARKIYTEEDLGLDLKNTVYAVVSRTIDLCTSLFPWALFRSTKSAVKIHTLWDLRGAIPAFVYLSDGKTHDTKVLDILVFDPGAFYVMDRGYIDFKRLYRLHQSGAFFVTRAKDNLRARRVYSAPTDRSTGVIADQRVTLEGFYAIQDYPEHIRRIRFTDPNSEKTLIFLTNNTSLPATTIAALYKNRWQVELFFKWIKQHLRIKHFFGTSENGLKTQIWSAVCTYVLIAIIKKELQLNASLYTCLQILSVCIFEKTQLSCALQPNDYTMKIYDNPKQLILFSN
jgi:hypothetical protein